MLPFPMKTLEVLVPIIYLLQLVCAFTMEGVRISNDKEFLHIQRATDPVLECVYTLKEGEEVKAVTWYHDNILAYKWSPPEPPSVGEGLEEGDAVLTRSDGFLEFARLHSQLAGKYRCEVMTSNGETFKSPDYQLLVVDMPEVSEATRTTAKVENCSIRFSWAAPAVRPKPEPVCGVWSIAHSYIQKAPSFQGTPYYNGSVGYRLDDEVFQVYNMPLDSLIRCELRITKIDDSRIQLLEESYNFTEVWERGCPPLEVGDGVYLEYDNERVTCHGEVRPKDETAPVIARVKCLEGFMPKYPDFVASVLMICEVEKWSVGDGLTWNHFDNLICVEQPKLPERPPPSHSHKDSTLSDRNNDNSSGVTRLMSPWAILLFVGITLFSGIAWGLTKTFPKKKDPRYLA